MRLFRWGQTGVVRLQIPAQSRNPEVRSRKSVPQEQEEKCSDKDLVGGICVRTPPTWTQVGDAIVSLGPNRRGARADERRVGQSRSSLTEVSPSGTGGEMFGQRSCWRNLRAHSANLDAGRRCDCFAGAKQAWCGCKFPHNPAIPKFAHGSQSLRNRRRNVRTKILLAEFACALRQLGRRSEMRLFRWGQTGVV